MLGGWIRKALWGCELLCSGFQLASCGTCPACQGWQSGLKLLPGFGHTPNRLCSPKEPGLSSALQQALPGVSWSQDTVPRAEERAEGRERILTGHAWTETFAQSWEQSASLPAAAFCAPLEERTGRKIPFQGSKEGKAVAHLPQPLEEWGVLPQPCSPGCARTNCLDDHEPGLRNAHKLLWDLQQQVLQENQMHWNSDTSINSSPAWGWGVEQALWEKERKGDFYCQVWGGTRSQSKTPAQRSAAGIHGRAPFIHMNQFSMKKWI